MLVKFSVSNYKSIQERVDIDMSASSIGELTENVIDVNDKKKLLKSVSVFGGNASGKSNILEALVIMRNLVIESAKDYQSKEPLPVDPFRLSTETEKQPSFFEMELIIKKKTYIYGFRTTKDEVINEWLIQKLKTTTKNVFIREGNKYKFGKRWEKNAPLERFSRENALFLSVAALFNVKEAENIVEWFMTISAVHGLAFENHAVQTISLMESNADSLKELLSKLMKRADLGIENLKVKRRDSDEDVPDFIKDEFKKDFSTFLENKKHARNVVTYHSKYNENGEVVGETEFNMSVEESDGTRKFFSLIGTLLAALFSGELVIIDEFDARLHPDLVKELIELFNSRFNQNSQLISVNFDTGILRKSLRRDQIYLAEKNDKGATQLSSMIEYNIRKGQPLEKQYRDGRVGGKPMIESFKEILSSTL